MADVPPPAVVSAVLQTLSPCDMVHYKGHLCQTGVKIFINLGKIWIFDVSNNEKPLLKADFWRRCVKDVAGFMHVLFPIIKSILQAYTTHIDLS